MDHYAGNRKWKTSTGLAFWGTSIQAVFSLIGLSLGMYLAYNLTDILLGGILPSVASKSLDYYENRFAGFIGGAMICFVIAFLGYLLYMVGVCLFTGAQESENSKIKTRNIMLAELIGPVLLILFYVGYYASPETLGLIVEHYATTGIALGVLFFASVIIPMVAFKGLSKEETWSPAARKGASNLSMSYSFIIWMIVVVILALGLTALVIYSSYMKINSLRYGNGDMYGALQGMNSVSNEITNLIGTVKVLVVFTEVALFILGLLYTVYKILGWHKIQNGGNEVTYQFRASSGVEEQEERTRQAITIVYEEEDDSRKKWLLWGGIAAGIIVIAGILWGVSSRKDETKAYEDMEDMVGEIVEEAISEESEPLPYRLGSAETDPEAEPIMDKVWLGKIELTGKVDGKYPIKMEITMDTDGTVSGTIWYLKYNVPMELRGTFTNTDYARDLSLEEISDGKVSGNFIGSYDGKVFSGTWVSADGAKEMPFKVER